MIPRHVLRPYVQALMEPYIDYCRNVSRFGMPVSIQTAALFAYVCCETKATRILDLGSGFTSYISHVLSDEAVSVDDSREWLDRTGSFLDGYKVGSDGLMLWDDWQASPGGPYQVVIHDFASGATREASMSTAVQVLAERGVVIFDDANHETHHAEMLRVADAAGLRFVDVTQETLDECGRYALMAVRP
jgi:SAM-dependent methyltransferase